MWRVTTTHSSSVPYYDIFEDFDLIVASFQTQYGIRIYSNVFKTMKWDEFHALLAGLGSDTPLGKVVQIRSEENEDRLKYFTEDQLRIRSDWQRRIAETKSKKEIMSELESMKQALLYMAGGG